MFRHFPPFIPKPSSIDVRNPTITVWKHQGESSQLTPQLVTRSSLLHHPRSPACKTLFCGSFLHDQSVKSENPNCHSCLLLSRSPPSTVKSHSGTLVFPSSLFPNTASRPSPAHSLVLLLLNLCFSSSLVSFSSVFSRPTPMGNHRRKRRAISERKKKKKGLWASFNSDVTQKEAKKHGPRCKVHGLIVFLSHFLALGVLFTWFVKRNHILECFRHCRGAKHDFQVRITEEKEACGMPLKHH